MRFILLVAALAAPVLAQPAPAVDVLDLMGVPFDTDRGTFFANGSEIAALFPTDGEYQLAVLDASAEAVATMRYVADPFADEPNFAELDPRRGLVYTSDPVPGSYRLAVLLDGDIIGAVPFSLASETSGDAFSSSTEWEIDGPWWTTGVVSMPFGDPDGEVRVRYWLHPRETGGASSVKVREVLVRNGTAVPDAGTEWSLRASFDPPYQRDHRLGIGRDDLADGDYRLDVVTEDGRTLRSWTFQIEGGQPVHHARSALDTPRDRFLTPRVHLRSDSNRNWNGSLERLWLTMD